MSGEKPSLTQVSHEDDEDSLMHGAHSHHEHDDVAHLGLVVLPGTARHVLAVEAHSYHLKQGDEGQALLKGVVYASLQDELSSG